MNFKKEEIKKTLGDFSFLFCTDLYTIAFVIFIIYILIDMTNTRVFNTQNREINIAHEILVKDKKNTNLEYDYEMNGTFNVNSICKKLIIEQKDKWKEIKVENIEFDKNKEESLDEVCSLNNSSAILKLKGPL